MSSMDTVERPQIPFDNTYARALPGFFVPWKAAEAPAPALLMLNLALAEDLGLDAAWLQSPDGLAMLAGNLAPEGSRPIAQAYAGHQFGGFSPQLGDGRALLLGEVIDRDGKRRDIQLKGSGKTPFSRGGDGKAAVGPVLREYLIGEAMQALGVPTTRALAAVATGETVYRETPLPGAVLTRISASHIRVGTFQFFAARQEWDKVRQLADYAIARHYPAVQSAENPYLAFFEAVVEAQASLVARWMNLGFIHGVMNTDNMTISGETIDYGPCAFMDAYATGTVFSSIDTHGRYAFGNQPSIAQWNLTRLAETLIPVIDPDEAKAIDSLTAALQSFADAYNRHWLAGMRAKLGLASERPGDFNLAMALLATMEAGAADFTRTFRALSAAVMGDDAPARAAFADPAAFDQWLVEWRARLAVETGAAADRAAAMDRVNPIYIPRNHKVEEALAAAVDADDMGPFKALLAVLTAPFVEAAGNEAYAAPAAQSDSPYKTFCGT